MSHSVEAAGQTSEQARPLLHVVKGAPTDDEVAALTAVVAALASARPVAPAAGTTSRWADPASRLRLAPRPGPTGWRTSGYPA
jgi:hypothetical protein